MTGVQREGQRLIILFDTYCGWCRSVEQLFDVTVVRATRVETMHPHLLEVAVARCTTESKGPVC